MTTITEDLHTSMLLHSRGWRSVYVNKDLSAGLAPESFDGYVTQRRRWSRGTMQVMLLRGGLWLRGLTLGSGFITSRRCGAGSTASRASFTW